MGNIEFGDNVNNMKRKSNIMMNDFNEKHGDKIDKIKEKSKDGFNKISG